MFIATALITTGPILLPSILKAKSISMVRDAEIESTIRSYAKPLLLAAGLEPSSVRIHIVKDNTLNAFVAGGQQIFINSGLILKSANVSQIIGVLAHEIGHISGGHLIKGTKARKDVSTASLLGVLLGGAAIIAGRPEAGAAAIQLGSSIGIKNYLKFSRTQESAADQSALRFLENTQQSATGLLEFMEVLEGQELLSAKNQDPYVRTHPLSQHRINTIRRHLNKSRFTRRATLKKDNTSHARIRAKLVGFTKSFSYTLREYPEPEGSLAAIYARSIAYYRKPNIQEAIRLVDKLIAKIPNDPYFHELKGQIYFENGKIDLALSSYQLASNLIPESALLRSQLGQVQIEKNDPEFHRMAIQNLLYSVNKDPTRHNVWRLLSIAYGRLNKKGESSRALAEEAILLGRNKEAIRIAERAKKQFKIGTPNWLRAEDISTAAQENIKQNKISR
jgi:predicted Zn-dependent protease